MDVGSRDGAGQCRQHRGDAEQPAAIRIVGGMLRAGALLVLIAAALRCICLLVDMLVDGSVRMDMHMDVRLRRRSRNRLEDLVEAIGCHGPVRHGKRNPGGDDAPEIGQRHQRREAPPKPSHARSNHRLALTRFVMPCKFATPGVPRQPARPATAARTASAGHLPPR